MKDEKEELLELAKQLQETASALIRRLVQGDEGKEPNLTATNTPDDVALLIKIWDSGGKSHVTKLSVDTDFSRPKVYKELERLQADGLIIFQKHNPGGRGNRPRCTPKGETRAQRFIDHYT